MYLVAPYNSATTLSTSYFIDGSDVAVDSFDSDLGASTGINVHKYAPSATNTFYGVKFKIENNEADQPWGLHGLRIYYDLLPLE